MKNNSIHILKFLSELNNIHSIKRLSVRLHTLILNSIAIKLQETGGKQEINLHCIFYFEVSSNGDKKALILLVFYTTVLRQFTTDK